MTLSIDFLEEVKLLNLYNLGNTQEGIKIHHGADAAHIDAGKRLFEKGIISLEDGGYLTPLGIEAAEYAQALITILK